MVQNKKEVSEANEMIERKGSNERVTLMEE